MQMFSDAHSLAINAIMSSTNPECHYHRSHYIGTLDCDVCYEHRKKMKANWSKEGIKRKFVKS